MEQELLDLNDQPNNNNADFMELANENLPDPDQVASEWNLDDDTSEEPVISNEEDPFAIMPINISDENWDEGADSKRNAYTWIRD